MCCGLLVLVPVNHETKWGDEMTKKVRKDDPADAQTRRVFLKHLGQGAAAGAAAVPLLVDPLRVAAGEVTDGKVARRTLGKTGLRVSEVGFGGHSWVYKKVPDGKGGYRRITIDEATEMIRVGMDMGVNFFDSCSPPEECSIPGEALKRLKRRDEAILVVRVSHKMKGVKADREEIYKWTEERLKLFQTDYVDLCMLSNTANDTEQAGYWDMSYSMEALDRLKQQGKIRFTGFGSHFTPELFLKAFDKFGDYFDVCSMPYNIRHREAEKLLPEAKKKKLGVVTIKPFARGSLLKKKDLDGADANLPRDMIAFVLKNPNVDVCICGLHTMAQLRKNFSASWADLSRDQRRRLDEVAAAEFPACGDHDWLEEGWLHA
jgi:aryl-alcohol dehydrogenase-like predicted oxidoreductase